LELKELPELFLFEYFSVILLLAALFAASFWIKPFLKWQKYIALLLIVLPIIYFYRIIDIHILNVPYIDDYDLLASILKLTDDGTFIEKTRAFFSQINQHRFGYERLVMWLILVVTGSESIKLQIIAGNLMLLGIMYMFWQTLKREGVSWYFLVPACLMFFNLVYYENANWGIAAIQNTSLLFFALLSAYALGQGNKSGWYIALVAAILTTFTSGSGLLAWVIGSAILLFQKKYQKLAVWLAVACAICSFYFLFDYHFIKSEADSPFKHPLYNLSFLLAFWGNVLYLDKPHPVISGNYYDAAACVVLGAGMAVIFAIWIFRCLRFGLSKTNTFIAGAYLFCMGTGAMLVLSRPISFYATNGGEVLSRRYMIFGAVLIVTTYIALILLTKGMPKLRSFLATSAMIFAISLNFFSYFAYTTKLRAQYENLSLDGHYWRNYGMMMSFGVKFAEKLFWNHPTQMTKLIGDLAKTGIYTLPDLRYPVISPQLPGDVVQTRAFAGSFYSEFILKPNQWIEGDTKFFTLYYNGNEDGFAPAYFQIRSASHLFILPALPVPNSVINFIKKRTYYDDRYTFSFFANKFVPGEYEVWIVGRDGKNWKSAFTGKKIQL
jgi:hypothetical protein